MWAWIGTRTLAGPELVLACPACGSEKAPATSYQYGERAEILPFLPASPYTETNYVKCGNCGEVFISKMNVHALPRSSPIELAQLLTRRVGLIPMTLAICGILLFFVPAIGLGVNAIALALNYQRQGHWTRRLSVVGSLLAFVVTCVAILAVLTADHHR